MKHRSTLIAVGVCWVAFSSAATCIARRQSVTGDEVAHIGAGVGYLQGDMRLNREHPPLLKLLAAWSLGLHEPPRVPLAVDDSTQWSFGHALLHTGAPGHALSLASRSRVPVLLLASLGLWLAALWAYALAGPVAAVSAAFFAACCPLWYAHATLVTTDAAVSVFSLASALSAWRVLRAPSVPFRVIGKWLLLLAASVALGTASKYSMVVAIAGLGLAALVAALPGRSWRALSWVWAALLVGGLLGCSFAWGWPPDPLDYVAGMRRVGFNHMQGYPFYAFGEYFVGAGSEPFYFVRALLVKLEWPLILLACLGLALLLSRALRGVPGSELRRSSLGDCAFLLIAPGVYLLVMSLFAPAVGVRYVLPVVPFAIVLAGVSVAELARLPRAKIALALACALELFALVQALRTSPIAWFNGFPCRTGAIPACLDDSNVDWGQSLPALADYRDAHFAGQPLRVFQFIRLPLSAYMTRAQEAAPMELLRPYRSLYAASLHSLTRMPPVSPFTRIAPLAVVGGSMAIFDLRGVEVLPAAPP